MGKRMTEKAITANRRNAQRSTGPKTADGKAVTSLNALKHGLRSSSLAVPVLEDADNWEAHLTQTLKALVPVGYLEMVLAERAASILWRLGRAVRYESLVIAASMENAEDERASGDLDRPPDLKDLQKKVDQAEINAEAFSHLMEAKDSSKVEARAAWGIVTEGARVSEVELWEGQEEGSPSILDLSGIPDEVEVDEWTGWTAGYLRKVLGQVAEKAGLSRVELVENMKAGLQEDLQAAKETLEKAFRSLETWRKTHLLPDEGTLDKVSKYESTLERSLFRTLHELERIQAARAGERVPLPAVAEISVSGEM